MVSIIRSLLLLAVAATAAEATAAEAAACATQCTTGCVTADVPVDTDVVVVKLCPSGEYPYIDSIKVDSATTDVFSVTTYTNDSMVQHFPDCYLTSSDGCEVSTTASCGLGVGEQTVVALRCENPTAACELRYDIDFICAELTATTTTPTTTTSTPTTTSSPSSSASSTGSSTSGSTTSPGSSSSTTSSSSTSTTAPTTSTPASSTSSRPATWSTSSPGTASSSTSSASNSTDTSGAMSRLSWKTIALSCGAVLGLNAMFV